MYKKKLVESGFVRWYNVKTKHLNPRRTRTWIEEAVDSGGINVKGGHTGEERPGATLACDYCEV